MTTENPERIWFLPQRFWEVTKTMRSEEADALMSRVVDLAERHELEALRKYDFIHYGTATTLRRAS